MIFGLVFLLLQSFLAFRKPKYFVFLYIVYISSFLGLLPKSIIVSGKEVGLYYQNILMLINYFLFYRRLQNSTNGIKILLNIIFVFFLYGLVTPIIFEHSDILSAIFASKEFSTIFLLHYLIINDKKIPLKFIKQILFFYGYYYLIVLVVFGAFKITLPQYYKGGNEIQIFYPTIVSLFLYIKSAEAKNIRKKIFMLFLLMLWSYGMYYEGHLSITLTTILGCIIITFRLPLLNFLKGYTQLILGAFILLLFLSTIPTSAYLKKFNQIGAISSREKINIQRVDLIQKNPYWGYGFVYKDALSFNSTNQYAQNVSIIDSGYIDLALKFGILGTFIYLFSLLLFLLKNTDPKIEKITYFVFFIQYLAVDLTWSVFTYSVGTMALSFAVFLYIKRDFTLDAVSNLEPS